MIQLWLAQNAMRLIAILALVASITAGYFYWKHSVQSERDAVWEDRAKQEIEYSKLLKHENDTKIAVIKSQYETHDNEQIKRLVNYAKTVNGDLAIANAAVSRLRGQTKRAVSCANGMPTKANNTEGNSRSSEDALSDSELAMIIEANRIIIEEYVEKYFEVK